jgi:hypothetical protein
MKKIYSIEIEKVKVTCYRDSEWKEYRVRTYIDGVLKKERDYHTNNRQDAIDSTVAIYTRAKEEKNRESYCKITR